MDDLLGQSGVAWRRDRKPKRASKMVRLGAMLVTAAVLAGCFGSPSVRPAPGDTPLVPEDLMMAGWEHDHADAAEHPGASFGIHELAHLQYVTDGIQASLTLLPGGRMVLAANLLFVVFVREDQRSGVAIIDVSAPDRMELLGTYRSDYGASEGEGLAVTPDGKTIFLTIETQYSAPPVPPAIEVIDASDPRNPRLSDRIFTADQPHVLSFAEIGGSGYLVVSGYQPTMLLAEIGVAPAVGAPSTSVSLYAHSPSAPRLLPVGRYVFDAAQQTPGYAFAHDTAAVEHPITKEQLLYVGVFGAGGIILNVDNPRQPREVGMTTDAGNATFVRHHSFSPGPRLVDGILPTAAVPYNFPAEGPAHLTIYDTADPELPALVGQWHHPHSGIDPGGNPPAWMHVPSFAENGTRLLIPHYHAGLFVFDTSSRQALRNLQPVGFWNPPGTPTPGALYAGSVVMAVQVGEIIYASEGVSGTLYALAVGDGPGNP